MRKGPGTGIGNVEPAPASLRARELPVTSPRQPSGLWRLAEFAFVAGILVPVVAVLSGVAVRRPLWYDELFSFYVASLPTAGAVLRALVDGAEIWPPLDFLVRHASMAAFGADAWGLRLPSIVAMAGFMVSLAAFARRRMSRAAAATVFVLPLATFALGYATEARGYMLLLCRAPHRGAPPPGTGPHWR